jgi:hypothetical protein
VRRRAARRRLSRRARHNGQGQSQPDDTKYTLHESSLSQVLPKLDQDGTQWLPVLPETKDIAQSCGARTSTNQPIALGLELPGLCVKMLALHQDESCPTTFHMNAYH